MLIVDSGGGRTAAVTDPTAFSSGLGNALGELNIDDTTIDSILQLLGVSEREVDEHSQLVQPLGGNLFGTLPAGDQLSTHAEGAREYLYQVMVELVASLGMQVEGLQYFRKNGEQVDVDSAESLRELDAYIADRRASDGADPGAGTVEGGRTA